MYILGRTFEHTARLFSLMTRVRINAFRLTRADESRSIPSESGPLSEPSYVIEAQIRSDVNEMRDSIVELLRLYTQCRPQASLEEALLATDKVLKSADDAWHVYDKGYMRDVLPSMFGVGRQQKAWKLLASNVRVMQARIQTALDELARHVQDLMPISLSEQIEARIHYDQIRQSPQGAIQLAFALFEDHLREKIGVGPELYGENLINAAFGKDGCLIFSEVPAEQVGARNLFSGVYATLRNPRMHRFLEDDESTALTIVALTDLLRQLIDKAESR